MSDCPPVSAPTKVGFIAFVRAALGVTTDQLPDDSVWFTYAFCASLELVNEAILAVSPRMYLLAVYNLAAHNLIDYAQDPLPIVPYPPLQTPPSALGFFGYLRKTFNSLGFVSGVIQAAADESTSDSLVVPESFKDWTLMNLQQAKDPYGRTYLSIASEYGPNAWGLT